MTPHPRADIKECSAEIVHNASVPVLVEAALQRESGSYLTSTGALAVRSGAKTGRSPKDKRIVEESDSVDNVWWGPVNIKMEEKSFMLNREYATRLPQTHGVGSHPWSELTSDSRRDRRAIDYLHMRDRIFVVDGYAGWDPKYRVNVRVLCSRAYHALFMKNMLVEVSPAELDTFVPDLVIINAGGFPANRYVDGVSSSCTVDLHLGRHSKRFGRTQVAAIQSQLTHRIPTPSRDLQGTTALILAG
jgi:phosphoenolpyruvate carboxykinase (ATP)